jgi:hypothetical protein
MIDTKTSIEAGSSNLKVALTYKAMSSATSGALVGALVAGPVGMVAGYIFFQIYKILQMKLIFFTKLRC